MKIFKSLLGGSPTYLDDSLKSTISPNLDYNYSLNRECVDLKYVPTLNNYPIHVDVYVERTGDYAISEVGKVYELNSGVRRIFLPPTPPLFSTITLVNKFGWDLQIFSTCNDLYVVEERFTYLEFTFCGGNWEVTKKGLASIQPPVGSEIYDILVQSGANTSDEYVGTIFGYGYLNFADIYELYSLGLDPAEIDHYKRYSNNTISFKSAEEVTGPISSVEISESVYDGISSFKVWNVSLNGVDISANMIKTLRLKFDPLLKFEMPLTSAMVREIELKLINTHTHTIDPIYSATQPVEIVEIYNMTSFQMMSENLDYTINDLLEIIPTPEGRIFYGDILSIRFIRTG